MKKPESNKVEKKYKIVVYTPESHARILRETLGNAGAGIIGKYTHCTFSIKGTGRSKPMQGATPTIGVVGEIAEIQEERIETVCDESKLEVVLKAIQNVHPYEESATEGYPLENK